MAAIRCIKATRLNYRALSIIFSDSLPFPLSLLRISLSLSLSLSLFDEAGLGEEGKMRRDEPLTLTWAAVGFVFLFFVLFFVVVSFSFLLFGFILFVCVCVVG